MTEKDSNSLRLGLLESPRIKACRPSDIDLRRVSYYCKIEQDTLLAGLISILKKNGNRWDIPRDRLEQIVAETRLTTKPGGIVSFVGLDSMEKILVLGALDISGNKVILKDRIVEHQARHNVKLLPSLKRGILQRLEFKKHK